MKFIENSVEKVATFSFHIPYYMKFSRHVNLRNLSDANKKCRKHNMTRKLSNSHADNQEKNEFIARNFARIRSQRGIRQKSLKQVDNRVNCEDVNVKNKVWF